MIVRIIPVKKEKDRNLWKEAEGLTMILGKITSTLDQKFKKDEYQELIIE